MRGFFLGTPPTHAHLSQILFANTLFLIVTLQAFLATDIKVEITPFHIIAAN
jgi:hypothetical protein